MEIGMPLEFREGASGSLAVIDFSQNGNSASFRKDGWSAQEPDMVWGVGPRSSLRLTVHPYDQPLILEAEIDPCRNPPTIVGQFLRVAANRVAIGSARLLKRSVIRCEIQPEIAGEDGVLDIEFFFPGFLRPSRLRCSQDTRPLSGSFSFVGVYTKTIYELGISRAPSRPDIKVVELVPPNSQRQEPDADASISAVYTFGTNGNVKPFLREGWASGEEEFTWTAARLSQIELPAPQEEIRHVLRVNATPLVADGELPAQEVTILLDGIVIGQLTLAEPSTVIVPLPRELVDKRSTLRVGFVLPDARRPSEIGLSTDSRLLGILVRRIEVLALPQYMASIEHIRCEQAGLALPIANSSHFLAVDGSLLPVAIEEMLHLNPVALLRLFESLGDNCEFGIVQRKMGLEVFNLFRFGNTRLSSLVGALTADLKAANQPSELRAHLNDARRREFVLTLPRYGLQWHTFAFEDETDEQTVLSMHATKLGYLRRKFYEGLSGGRKTYVIKRQRRIPLSTAAAVLMELNRHGRAVLLCVEPTPAGRRSGEVDLVMPGLMRGYVSQFAPEDDVESVNPADWLRVAANATLLNRGVNARFRR
jgi:hypothetical protein